MVFHKGNGGLCTLYNIFLHVSAAGDGSFRLQGALYALLYLHFLTHHNVRTHPNGKAHNKAKHYLAKELTLLTHPFLIVLEHLDVVIGKAKRAAPEGAHKKEDDVYICKVAPKEHTAQDGEDYDDPAHGGGAFLLDLALQAKVTDSLPDLLFLQETDNLLAGNHGNKNGRDGRRHGAEAKEVNESHSGEIRPQALKILNEVEDHCIISLKVSVTISFSSK